MNRSFWRGFVAGILATILFVTAWDLDVYGFKVYRGWVGRAADALHEYNQTAGQ